MSGVVGQQNLMLAGMRFYLKRSDDSYGALVDLGTLRNVTANITNETVTAEDADGGRVVEIDEEVIKTTEEYTVECINGSLDNLALMFLASMPEAFTQTTSVINSVVHKVAKGAGRMIKLVDASGVWLYNINTITITGAGGSPSYAEGTHWRWVSKERGIIQWFDGSAVAEGTSIEITITPNAITGKRLVRPQSSATIRGRALLVWSQRANQIVHIREFDAVIVPESPTISAREYSAFPFRVKVVSDVLNSTTPAGRLILPVGSLPPGAAA